MESETEPIEGSAEEIEVEEAPLEEPLMTDPAQELVPHSASQGDVMRPLNADQLVESFQDYQRLRGRLLNEDDYQDAGRGKQFVKKSGWRKIATAFGLNVEIRSQTVERDDDGQPTRAEVVARAIAPNGRFSDGDGYCSVDEDRFSGPRGNRPKLENDLRATATTRAKNRAISDLVGMGEVSAEEAGDDAPRALDKWATERQQEGLERAVAYVFSMLGQIAEQAQGSALSVVERIVQSYGGVPQEGAGAIILLAKQVQQQNQPASGEEPDDTNPQEEAEDGVGDDRPGAEGA